MRVRQKSFWNDRAKTIFPGILPTDPLLAATVLFKTVTGLKWITWGSKNNCFLSVEGENTSQGDPPKDPLLAETALFKTVTGLK